MLYQTSKILELPKAESQFRQDYGLRAHVSKGGLSLETNNLKEILRQSYGLGPARICFKPQFINKVIHTKDNKDS